VPVAQELSQRAAMLPAKRVLMHAITASNHRLFDGNTHVSHHSTRNMNGAGARTLATVLVSLLGLLVCRAEDVASPSVHVVVDAGGALGSASPSLGWSARKRERKKKTQKKQLKQQKRAGRSGRGVRRFQELLVVPFKSRETLQMLLDGEVDLPALFESTMLSPACSRRCPVVFATLAEYYRRAPETREGELLQITMFLLDAVRMPPL
jgi:hypothetical protein